MFDLEAARKAGYNDAEIADGLARRFSFDIKKARGSGYSDGEVIARLVQQNATLSPAAAIPTAPTAAQAAQGSRQYVAPAAMAPVATGPAPTLVQRGLGTAEAGLSLATGMTGGALGMIGGTVGATAAAILDGSFGTQQAAQMVEQAASEGAQALTYAPRTAEGQEQAAVAGQAMQEMVPLAGLTPQMAGLGRAVGPAATAVRTGAAAVADKAAPALQAAARVADLAGKNITTLPRRAMEALRSDPDTAPTPGTMGSVGAAGTDMATMRRTNAEALGFVGDRALTKGQATRDAAQLKFETESAKIPDEGAPLRDRLVRQNQQILHNFDGWIDQTGAEAPNLRAVGTAVDRALVTQAARDKAQIRAAYQSAEKAGELEQPVQLQSMVQHLNDSAPDSATAPVLDVARRRAVQLGIAREEGGQLVPQPTTLRLAETYRQAVSRATDYEATNVRQATIIKGLVDEATDGLGGDLYRRARGLRRRFAQNYEDRATVARLLETKRGTSDRRVAFEDVFDQTVLKGSLDDVRNVRRVLQRGGPEGAQAWRELQGQTARWVKDQAERNVATDSLGNRVVSVDALDKAVKTLDADGRLDFIFGKQAAQQMRDIRDLAQVARTVPPEAAVNTSNTASALLTGFFDIGSSSLSGMPLPLATMVRVVRQHVKDSALRRRIEDALGKLEKRAPNNKRKGPAVQEPPSTVH